APRPSRRRRSPGRCNREAGRRSRGAPAHGRAQSHAGGGLRLGPPGGPRPRRVRKRARGVVGGTQSPRGSPAREVAMKVSRGARGVALVLALALLLGPLSEARPEPPSLWTKTGSLRDEGKLTEPELGTVDRGGILAKVIDTPDHSEVLSL